MAFDKVMKDQKWYLRKILIQKYFFSVIHEMCFRLRDALHVNLREQEFVLRGQIQINYVYGISKLKCT